MPDSFSEMINRATPTCPECGSALQWHSMTEWCLTCGYARNLHPDPETGRAVIRHGNRWGWSRHCLICDQGPANHRFAAVGGPDGWLCEDHKDGPATVNGTTYGETERR